MSETDEWTVVSSRSRQSQKKTSNAPVQREEDLGPGLKRNSQSRYNQSSRSSQPQIVGSSKIKAVSATFSTNSKRHEYASSTQPGLSKSSQSSVRQQKPSSSYQLESKKERTKTNEELKATLPINRAPTVLPTTKGKEVKFTGILKRKPGCDGRSINLQAKAQAQCSTFSLIKNVEEISNETKLTPSSNVEKVENVASGSTTASTSKKKKKGGKEDRRKRREEMFYRALYQSKDSHIQFVSADMIRKIQNDQRGHTSKTTSSKSFVQQCPPPPVQTTLAQSFNCMNLQEDFEDFPSLTPNKSSDEKRKARFDSASDSTAHDEEPSTSTNTPFTPKTNSNESECDRGENVSPFSKCVSEAIPETPTPGKCTPLTPNCSKGKKSKQPMIIDVSSLIVCKKKERDSIQRKSTTPNTQYGRTGTLKKENFKITPGNPLDSSGPGVINRGKIRQKKKKPTKLKLTILRSRALKKILLEGESKQNLDNYGKINTIDVKEEFPSIEPTTVLVDSSTKSNDNLKELVDEKVKIEAELDVINNAEEEVSSHNAEINTDDILENNQNNIITDNSDISLKFIKLLDEISMLKIVDDTFPPDVELAVKASMHNRKFRNYCDMYTSKELHKYVMTLLSDLFRFQDRLYHTDPIKFKTKRRIVSGLKEALCYLNLNKVQLLIIAPDIERNSEPGGLDEKITQILTVANGKNVPYVFSSSKYNLGKPMRIKTPISIISVLDKQNCEETFRALLEEASQLREKYHNDFAIKAKELKDLGK